MGSVIQMAGTSAGGTETSLATIDVPADGFITGVEWGCRADFDTDNDFQTWQLTFGSTTNVGNDSRANISNVTLGGLTFTAGGSVIAGASKYTSLPDIPVSGGERLFLHSVAAAGVVGVALCCIHFSFEETRNLPRRR